MMNIASTCKISDMTTLMSRPDAVAAGLRTYFTGEPCPKGHICTRRTINGACVQCCREYSRKWIVENPAKAKEREKRRSLEKRRASTRKWYAKNREYISKYKKDFKEKYPDRYRETIRKWRAANKERLQVKARKDAGLPDPTRPRPEFCELCNKRDAAGRDLSLDHCHKTGKFRGWLCGLCNTAIGKLGDDIAGLRAAMAYLERAE